MPIFPERKSCAGQITCPDANGSQRWGFWLSRPICDRCVAAWFEAVQEAAPPGSQVEIWRAENQTDILVKQPGAGWKGQWTYGWYRWLLRHLRSPAVGSS